MFLQLRMSVIQIWPGSKKLDSCTAPIKSAAVRLQPEKENYLNRSPPRTLVTSVTLSGITILIIQITVQVESVCTLMCYNSITTVARIGAALRC